MRGWVYVISNPAMPGLIKVGHSLKDPKLRAQELNNTGSPHPYQVEYEMLIESPAQVEHAAHRALSDKREGREWFRCSREEAVATIQQVAEGRAVLENFIGAEREKAERLRKEKADLDSLKRLINAHVRIAEQAIQKRYDGLIASRFPENPFWQYWLGCSLAAILPLALLFPKHSDSATFLNALIVGAIVAFFLKDYVDDRRKQSTEYIALIHQKDSEMDLAGRSLVLFCSNQSCRQPLRFGITDVLSSLHGSWTCTKCRMAVSPAQALQAQVSSGDTNSGRR
jgi:hypothetical protein